jgi:hypothetical protein
MKHIGRYVCILSLLSFWIPFAAAQNTASLSIGFGTFHVKSNGSGIDNLNSLNAGGSCTPGTGDVYCQANPALSNFFLGFGGDVMLSKKFGIGAEITFMPSKANYGPLLFRETFYDFDGVSVPYRNKHLALKLMGGIGGAKSGFSINESSCVGTAVCSNYTQSFGSSNHFQIHAGAGVEIYLTKSLFIRPQFDLHYVPNFTQQFGSNVVPGGMIWIGFRTGDH